MASTSTMPTIKSGRDHPTALTILLARYRRSRFVIVGRCRIKPSMSDGQLLTLSGWNMAPGQAPSGFLRKAAAQWPRIVEQVTSSARPGRGHSPSRFTPDAMRAMEISRRAFEPPLVRYSLQQFLPGSSPRTVMARLSRSSASVVRNFYRG